MSVFVADLRRAHAWKPSKATSVNLQRGLFESRTDADFSRNSVRDAAAGGRSWVVNLYKPSFRGGRAPLLGIGVVVCACLLGCAPGPNPQLLTPDSHGAVAGFWLGVWHGFIVLVTFVVSLFNPQVQIYEVHNNGGWYNFGYVVGLLMALGGGGSASRHPGIKKRQPKKSQAEIHHNYE